MPRKIIDVGAFFGTWPKWHIPRNLSIEGLDAYGIDMALISSLQAVFYDCADGNKEVLEIVSREPRFTATCSVSPYMGDRALKIMEECSAAGAKAVRLYPQHHDYDVETDPLVDDICMKAAELKMPVWLAVRLIMDWSLPVLNIKAIMRTIKKFPGTDFVVSGVNYGEFRPILAGIRELDNLYVELSSFQMLGGIEQLVLAGGADKLLFGTGLPLQYPLCNTLKVDVAQITEEDKNRVFHGNAKRLFRL